MIDIRDKNISVRRQCELLSVCRSRLFYRRKSRDFDRELLFEIKKIHDEIPFYGYRKITHELHRRGYKVNMKKVRRITTLDGIFALIPKRYSKSAKNRDLKHPFLLNYQDIYRANQVWSADISYIKMPHGFLYLLCIIDVYSRMILAWRLSIAMDVDFCPQPLREALEKYDHPEIINTDQGSQFTSSEWIKAVTASNIRVSMDGKGRWSDNVYIERVWRTIKQENVFLMDFQTVSEAKQEIAKFIDFYNYKRLHQNLGYKTPNEVYIGSCKNQSFVYAKLTKPQILQNLV
jgi:putative transposase